MYLVSKYQKFRIFYTLSDTTHTSYKIQQKKQGNTMCTKEKTFFSFSLWIQKFIHFYKKHNITKTLVTSVQYDVWSALV